VKLRFLTRVQVAEREHPRVSPKTLKKSPSNSSKKRQILDGEQQKGKPEGCLTFLKFLNNIENKHLKVIYFEKSGTGKG